MMKTNMKHSAAQQHRRGSTLVIVIALLGLLAFMGMVFFSFASQERAASENFSQAAKSAVDEPPNVFDHMLKQVIVGPGNSPSERVSILRSTTRRHSMVSNLVGNDIHPHTGEGVDVRYLGGLPDTSQDLNSDGIYETTNDWLDFVDSPVARVLAGYRERGFEATPLPQPPEPDVDYTYPDLNNLFLAYKGWAVRDNGDGTFTKVPVIIPSFFRPQYMKSSTTNGPSGNNVPTDNNWANAFDGTDRTTARFPARSYRPHPQHIAGRLPDGTPVPRFLTDAEATSLGLTGGFPFIPANHPTLPNTAVQGELGIWTGSNPDVYELDADNDGDNVNEGIWLDLNFPVQETAAGKMYVILHSVTVYDLDALIDVNVHGNLAGMFRSGNISNAAILDGTMSNQFVSRSSQGLGPNEINPIWAMRRGPVPGGHASAGIFNAHFGRLPLNDIEQANMEWIWLLTGHGKYDGIGVLENIFAGRWGESDRVYNAIGPSATRLVSDLPRPGRSGNAQAQLTNGVRYGGDYNSAGRDGFDDNMDRYEGEANVASGRLRAFVHPMDYAGTGKTTNASYGGYDGTSFTTANGLLRAPSLYYDGTHPETWPRYHGYSINRGMDDSFARYTFGRNGAYDGGLTGTDDLVADPFYDALFEDPLETIFDVEFADRKFDEVFGPTDLLNLHLTPTDKASSPDDISERLNNLAPFAFENSSANDVRERFTTLSNSLRRFMMKHDLGADMLLGTTDDGPRAWEFNADTDGADNDGDGYGDGDNPNDIGEFPPKFGTTPMTGLPYSNTDPFRPQVRRLLTVEAGESRELIGQLPLSINHILDVERNAQTPDEQAQPVQFLRYMQRAGLRFRPLTEHPDSVQDTTVLSVTTVPTWTAGTPVQFPPQTTPEREFWARRDRQKLARDIYVLLYTLGGARPNAAGTGIRNYTLANDPSLPEADTTSLYTHTQLRQMAQFAVNMVDAMDTDGVITKFEYDKNLGDGWNLDDDAFTNEASGTSDATTTANGLYPEDTTDRGVVYGVESQTLAFSEALAIRTPLIGGGHVATPFADDIERDFMYVELQNMSPVLQKLATTSSTTADTAIWRLVREDRLNRTDVVVSPSSPQKAVAFLNHTDNEVTGGGRFSIGGVSDTGMKSSGFFLDLGNAAAGTFDGTFELIAPNISGATLPTGANIATSGDPAYDFPLTDLDLIHPSHATGHYDAVNGNFLENISAYAGNDVFDFPVEDQMNGDFAPAGRGFDLILQRRLNPDLPGVAEASNPWVEVDRMRLLVRDLPLAGPDLPAQIYTPGTPEDPGPPVVAAVAPTGYVTNLNSLVRSEPLDDWTRQDAGASTLAEYRFNTVKGVVGVANDLEGVNTINEGLPFQLWQPHFDRDFASPGELLNVPVFGPNLLTQRLQRSYLAPYQQAFGDPTTPVEGAQNLSLISGAAALFLMPDFPNATNPPIPPAAPIVTLEDKARDNRWYRLFQFVEVPSRVHRMLGNYVSLPRVPGKLNLNTIRHWEVYAGLVDNPTLLDREPNPANNRFTTDRTINSASTPVNRDRWREYLVARDGAPVSGYDPATSTSKQYLIPGTPNARPFHSPGYHTRKADDNGAESTIFRMHSGDLGNPATNPNVIADRNDSPDGISHNVATNRNWLEVADRTQHQEMRGVTSSVHQHQLLTKIMNNTTTVSNTFIVYSTAAYFEAVENPPNSGIIQIGSRIDLEPNAAPPTNPGWQQRAVFVIDRTEAFKAYDPGTGDFDWKRLVKARATIE